MEFSGFRTIAIEGGRPYNNRLNPLARVIDRILSSRPTLARRVIYLGVKTSH